MTDLRTARLTLHPTDTVEAGRIIARQRGAADFWAYDYPSEGDIVALGALLEATAAGGDQRPFGYYRITRSADGMAIGGIGFIGQPDNGSVEIGYGLVPSARKNGYATEALRALVALAHQEGVARVVATTDGDNIASQRTLERAGFTHTGMNGDLDTYEAVLVA